MLDIACPESCTYLIAGRGTTNDKSRALVLKTRSEFSRLRKPFDHSLITVMVAVEGAIVQARRRDLRDINDRDILEALDNAKRNSRTADTGLIYEHRAPSPVVQELSRHIREGIRNINEHLPSAQHITGSEELAALETLAEIVQVHIDHGDDDKSYLRSIAVRLPWKEDEKPTGLLVTP